MKITLKGFVKLVARIIVMGPAYLVWIAAWMIRFICQMLYMGAYWYMIKIGDWISISWKEWPNPTRHDVDELLTKIIDVEKSLAELWEILE